MAMSVKRLVLSIQRMTIHNGPGLRTLVLFKGCPLRCLWCSTPESQKLESEIAVYPNKCSGCHRCVDVCPSRAITLCNDRLSVNRSLCNDCGKCADVCYSEAIKLLGLPMTPEELLEEVKKDLVMYRHSGGGVTISGGEPLSDPDFNRKFLDIVKHADINVGVDTSGYVPWTAIEPILHNIGFFLWDIKIMDPISHKKLTGVSNELILRNVQKISDKGIPIYLRIPVIPGYNDSEENIRTTCKFAQTLSSVVEVDILPLHHLGKARYESLDRIYPISNLSLIPDNVLQDMKDIVESYGLKCRIGG
jgi:pyruvate formate lyase activating enzyme